MAKVRKAGVRIKQNRELLDAMEDPGPAANGGSGSSSDLSAKEEGFRNSLDRRLGAEEYDRLGAVGQQDPTEAGDYSAKEVIAEFRNAKKGGYSGVDEGDNSVVDYFKKLQEEGATFNNKAQEYLGRFGFEFTKPKPEVNETVAEEVMETAPEVAENVTQAGINVDIGISEPETIVSTPDYTFDDYSPNFGGIYANIGKQGDMTTTIGDNNTIGAGAQIGNDFSTTIGGQSFGNDNYFGIALNDERQRRASQGAFGAGVAGGLNFG